MRAARIADSPMVTPQVGSAAPSPKYRTLAWVVLGASSTRRVELSGEVPGSFMPTWPLRPMPSTIRSSGGVIDVS